MKQYICLHCGHAFDGDEIVAKYYDRATGCYDREECPNCSSEDFEEAAVCEDCGEVVSVDDIVGRLCRECVVKNESSENALAYGEDRKECVELNGFLAWMVREFGLDYYLKKVLENLTDAEKTRLVKEYCEDDIYDFSEWITDEREEDK